MYMKTTWKLKEFENCTVCPYKYSWCEAKAENVRLDWICVQASEESKKAAKSFRELL